MCYQCKQAGRNTHEFPKKTKNGGNGKANQRGGQCTFQGKCDNCRRQGHKADACWEKAKNKDKRPTCFKGKTNGKIGAAATDGGRKQVKFLLC